MNGPRVRIRAVAHGLLPRRLRPNRPVQLAARPPDASGVLHPAHRRHRRGAQPRGVGRGHLLAPWPGSGSTLDEGPVSPERLRGRARSGGRGPSSQRATSTTATARPRWSTSARAPARPGLRRVLPGPRARRAGRHRPALPHASRGRHRRARPHPRRRGVRERLDRGLRRRAAPSGVVLFALANVTDDRHDRITHVIRGEEHLANAPKQMMLWAALNAAEWRRRAAPAVRAPPAARERAAQETLQAQRPGRRPSPTATRGTCPTAFVNYLALLGWSPRGDEEIVPLATMIEQFRLEDVSHSPAFFDVKKLTHMNGEYMRALSIEEFVDAAPRGCDPWSSAVAAERPRAALARGAVRRARRLRAHRAAGPRARRDARRDSRHGRVLLPR